MLTVRQEVGETSTKLILIFFSQDIGLRGELLPITSDARLIRHYREDIIARIERGDFDD